MSMEEPLITTTLLDEAVATAGALSGQETKPPGGFDVIDVLQSKGTAANNLAKKTMKKRAADAISVLDTTQRKLRPAGNAWAACVASEIRLDRLQQVARRKVLASSKLELRLEQFFSDVFVGYVLVEGHKASSDSTLMMPSNLGHRSVAVHNDNVGGPGGGGGGGGAGQLPLYEDQPQSHTPQAQSQSQTKPRRCQIFTFKFGCICAWDLPPELRTDLITLMEIFLESPVRDVETDTINYIWSDEIPTTTHTTHTPNNTANQVGGVSLNNNNNGCGTSLGGILEDTIHLSTRGARHQLSMISPDDMDTYLAITTERLAYSYGLAQSCKLSVFEINIENAISRTRKIPECLARYGNVTQYSRHDISIMIGELFMHRFNMNLQCDIILDTPDIFWEENENILQVYTATRNYLDITERCKHLNLRLDIIKDLYDILNQEMTIQHNNKLEWIVIFLIAAEIFIEVVWNIMVKDVFKLF